MTEKKIYLTQAIGPGFYSLHREIKDGAFTHYWLKGGRGSGKSSFISIEIVLGMMADGNANAVVMRKVAANLKDSVLEQIWWAITRLGVEAQWEKKLTGPELIYRRTGQRILFRGGDDPRKIKSVKFSKGYGKYLWFEEVDEFGGMDEIRSIQQSFMRGGTQFCIFYSCNPPKSLRSWVNQEMMMGKENRRIHHSTYLDMPKAWLGEQFFLEALHVKKVQEQIYRHEYLGEVTGTGGEVFQNITLREITDAEIASFDRVARGLDWGYAVDPLHYTVNHYDKTRSRLFIFYEVQKQGLSNRRAAEEVAKENILNQEVICDSAEPKSIAEICDYGIRASGAKKGPDSVGFGMRWLRGLEEIIIDPKRCPYTAKEFSGYEFERDGSGGWKDRYPDRGNHSIDAVRYSRQEDMRRIRVR